MSKHSMSLDLKKWIKASQTEAYQESLIALQKLSQTSAEYTGGSVGYYSVDIDKPTTEGRPAYTAECNDIIEALGMSYAEGNAFKATWRKAAARNLGLRKAGYTDGLYDAEKVEFFGKRMVAQESKS